MSTVFSGYCYQLHPMPLAINTRVFERLVSKFELSDICSVQFAYKPKHNGLMALTKSSDAVLCEFFVTISAKLLMVFLITLFAISCIMLVLARM